MTRSCKAWGWLVFPTARHLRPPSTSDPWLPALQADGEAPQAVIRFFVATSSNATVRAKVEQEAAEQQDVVLVPVAEQHDTHAAWQVLEMWRYYSGPTTCPTPHLPPPTHISSRHLPTPLHAPNRYRWPIQLSS